MQASVLTSQALPATNRTRRGRGQNRSRESTYARYMVLSSGVDRPNKSASSRTDCVASASVFASLSDVDAVECIRNGAARIIDKQTQAASEGALGLSRLKIDRAVKAGYREIRGGR